MKQQEDSLRMTALRTWVAFLIIMGGVLLVLFMYAVRSVLLQLLIAVIFAIALSPLVGYFLRRGFRRVTASVLTMLITVFVLLGVIGAIASPLIAQGDDLIQNAPKIIERTASSPIVQNLDRQFQIIDKAKDLSREAPALLGSGKSPLLGALGSVFSAVSSLLVILILALFMLIEGPTAWSQFVRLLGPHRGDFVNAVARKIRTAVGGFVNGNLFISLIAGIFTLILLLVTGVPYAFALAALVAVFDLIPLVGAVIATVVVGLVALTEGLVITLIVVTAMLIYQFVEGNIIQPIVYGKAVRMSQLLIVIATIIGGLLGGIIGVLLAIPVAAAVQIIIVELLRAGGANLEPDIARSVKR